MDFAKVESGLKAYSAKLLFPVNPNKKQPRTYIFPTGFGFAFALMCVVLLIMAVGYSNNLIYFFVFFFISVGLTTMLVTNRNLDRIEIGPLATSDSFANEVSSFYVCLKTKTDETAWDLKTQLKGSALQNTIPKVTPSEQNYEMKFLAPNRGKKSLGNLVISSSYPFGLFRAWKTLRLSEEVVIFPQRKGDLPVPLEVLNSQNLGTSGLFRNLREYQPTDNPRRIDWRASRKHQELLIKNFESAEQMTIVVDFAQTKHLENPEVRLSQMSLWIDNAEKRGFRYSMRLGNIETHYSQGIEHWRECLTQLALFESRDAQS